MRAVGGRRRISCGGIRGWAMRPGGSWSWPGSRRWGGGWGGEGGVLGESGGGGGRVLDDGVTRQASRDHVSACGLCHNVPWQDAGAGATISKNGGTGRNTPHLFGAGLIEMLGWQIR